MLVVNPALHWRVEPTAVSILQLSHNVVDSYSIYISLPNILKWITSGRTGISEITTKPMNIKLTDGVSSISERRISHDQQEGSYTLG